jgi:hypothetical protein
MKSVVLFLSSLAFVLTAFLPLAAQARGDHGKHHKAAKNHKAKAPAKKAKRAHKHKKAKAAAAEAAPAPEKMNNEPSQGQAPPSEEPME